MFHFCYLFSSHLYFHFFLPEVVVHDGLVLLSGLFVLSLKPHPPFFQLLRVFFNRTRLLEQVFVVVGFVKQMVELASCVLPVIEFCWLPLWVVIKALLVERFNLVALKILFQLPPYLLVVLGVETANWEVVVIPSHLNNLKCWDLIGSHYYLGLIALAF